MRKGEKKALQFGFLLLIYTIKVGNGGLVIVDREREREELRREEKGKD